MYRGVIFDLDNTIYNYSECDREASNRLECLYCKKLGVSKIEFRILYENAKDVVKQRLGMVAASHNRILYMQAFLELLHKKPSGLALEMYDVYWNSMLESMKLFDYVIPYFKYLKHHDIQIGILTDLTAHIQHRKICALGIEDYIDCLVTSEEVGEEKPSPKMFDLMLVKLALKPEEVCMIGDSNAKDVAGADKSGIHGVMLTKEICKDTECRILRKLLMEGGTNETV